MVMRCLASTLPLLREYREYMTTGMVIKASDFWHSNRVVEHRTEDPEVRGSNPVDILTVVSGNLATWFRS